MMDDSEIEIEVQRQTDSSRRAVAILTAAYNHYSEVNDPAWLWDSLGDNSDERYDTLISILSITEGVLEAHIDPVSVVESLGERMGVLEQIHRNDLRRSLGL